MSKRKLQYPTELPNWKGVSFTKDQKRVRKDNSWFDESRVDRTVQFLKYLIKNPHPTIVTILNCRRISSNEYSYFMPLMANLSNSEAELTDLYTSGNSNSDYRKANLKRISFLKKKHPKLFQVIKKIESWGTYHDLHEGNLMRDQYGNYKLIDIEGFGFAHYSFDDLVKSITVRR
jgi:hypothetical protein